MTLIDGRAAFSGLWTRVRALATAVVLTSLPAQRIVQQFRDVGALTPATARRFHAGSTIDEIEFLRLLRAGIIREATPGRYFLDQRQRYG